jgi:hypothetical protein
VKWHRAGHGDWIGGGASVEADGFELHKKTWKRAPA